MPWDPESTQDRRDRRQRKRTDVASRRGDSGPLTPIGVNLSERRAHPRAAWQQVHLSRQRHGGLRAVAAGSYWTEFSWTREEARARSDVERGASELATSLHEVIGHGSGQADPSLGTSASAALREYYSTIEETRADLVALYFVPHPKLADAGRGRSGHQAEVPAPSTSLRPQRVVQLRRVARAPHLEEDPCATAN